MAEFGVHSEVGKLRKVLVHRPDLSLRRLTPANHDDLLFDDVLWVDKAQEEHDAFAQVMRDRGVEVFYVHDLLAETLAAIDDEAKSRYVERVSAIRGGPKFGRDLEPGRPPRLLFSPPRPLANSTLP